jgi:uncharacterized cupredoxin-like copper-binding protein
MHAVSMLMDMKGEEREMKANLACALAAVAAVVTACSGGKTGGAVAVTLSEYAVAADPQTVAPGRVAFTAKNAGQITHEMVVLRTDRVPDALATAEGKVDEDASGTVIGEIPEAQLPPGAESTLMVDLPAGRYVLFCNIPGHYQAGMRTQLTVR